MARLTVNEIMTQVAATVNQEATAPTDGSSEWSLWLAFINRATNEWAEANDWEELRKVFRPSVSGVSQATVALPGDFKKIASAPKLNLLNATDPQEFPEILPEQAGLYQSIDQYIEVRGNISDGFNMIFHPGTLASGASLSIHYFSTPTALASGTQVPALGDSQYLADRVIGYILEARSDPRFQQQESKAREKLLNMVEQSNLAKYSSYANPNPVMTSPLRKMGFRLGRD